MSVKLDIAANICGRVWLALLALCFAPIYLNLLGVEAFGLVGVYTTMQVAFTLFDVGLSSTLNREMARNAHDSKGAERARDLLKTLQTVYILLTAGMVVVSILAARPIAQYWIRPDKLSPGTVQSAVCYMGISTSFQMLFAFYSGGLLGLRRQLLYNVVNASAATARFVGSVLILTKVSRTVEAFFIGQAATNALGALAIAYIMWRALPRSPRKARFRREVLSSTWRFAGGLWATAVLGFLLGQADKLVVSKLVTLETFGYYSLAGIVASSIRILGDSVYTAFFPVFSRLVAAGDVFELKCRYHRASQIMAVAVLPAAGVMMFFPREVVFTWTGNQQMAGSVSVLVTLLACGTALSLLASIGYALQLAYAWTRLGLFCNLAGCVLFTPALILAVQKYGIAGAAAIWVLLNAGFVFIGVRIMHCRLLPGEYLRWLVVDVGLPAAAMCAAATVLRLCFQASLSRFINLAALGAIYWILLAASLLAAPGLWRPALNQWRHRFREGWREDTTVVSQKAL